MRRILAAAAVTIAAAAGVVAGGTGTAGGTTVPVVVGVPTPHHQIIVFIPHADDDVLSMGVFIHREVQAGHDVRVVYYTDGAGTGICSVDVNGICEANNQFHGISVNQFIADRDSELQHSLGALGVPLDHIDYGTYGYRFRDGRTTVADATWMLQTYHADYPDATLLTMSWIDGHPDHGAAGRALRALVQDGTIPADEAIFSIARWYWAYDYPQRSPGLKQLSERLRASMGFPLAPEMLRCDDGQDPTCAAAIHNAVESYHSASDEGDGYGIGYSSVPVYLDETDRDPAIILHGVAAGRYPARTALVSATRGSTGSTTATLTGTVTLPDYGHYGDDVDNPASAKDLVQTLVGSLVTAPLPAGTHVIVSALNASGKVLERGTATLSGTQFHLRLPVPVGAVRVVASTPGSAGVLPSTVSWPVEAQQVTLPARTGVRIAGTTLSGSYGRRFAVAVRTTLGGKGVRGARVTLSTGSGASQLTQGPSAFIAHTGTSGTVTVAGVLDRTASWRVITAAAPGVIPAVGSGLRTKVTAARVVARSAVTSLRAHRTTTVKGVIAGRDYRIAPAYLRPTRIKVWLVAPGRPSVVLARTTSTPGGSFSVSVHPPHAGTLVWDVIALPGVYQPNPAAGRIPVR